MLLAIVAERLPDNLGAIVERAAGPLFEVQERSWSHQVTRVWRIQTRAGIVWLKQHSQRRKFLQESRAYTHVAPALAAMGYLVPARLAEDSTSKTLVLTDLGGQLVRREPDHEAWLESDPALHYSAGQITRALHTLPLVDDDPLPSDTAIRYRADRWLEEAHDVLDSEEEARVCDAIGDGSAFSGMVRVWCHRDWSPRNWIADTDGRIGMIDFEHCCPDFALMDFVKLYCGVWQRHPHTERAFFEGYGRTLDPIERDRLRRLLWLHAISTISWAVAHRDPEFEGQGRTLLRALKAGWMP